MFTPGFERYLDIKERHQELIKEAEQERLAIEAMKANPHRKGGAAVILAVVGKSLMKLGSRLDERYGVQPEAAQQLNQQSSAGGC